MLFILFCFHSFHSLRTFLFEQRKDCNLQRENNLNYLLQNAGAEPYVMATSVTLGDTTLGWCGLRTKGNYTLHHSDVSNPGSDRFSFTVNFGKYIKKEQYGETQIVTTIMDIQVRKQVLKYVTKTA